MLNKLLIILLFNQHKSTWKRKVTVEEELMLMSLVAILKKQQHLERKDACNWASIARSICVHILAESMFWALGWVTCWVSIKSIPSEAFLAHEMLGWHYQKVDLDINKLVCAKSIAELAMQEELLFSGHPQESVLPLQQVWLEKIH